MTPAQAAAVLARHENEYTCSRCGHPVQRCELWCRALKNREIEQALAISRKRSASGTIGGNAAKAAAAGIFGLSAVARIAIAIKGGHAAQARGTAHRWTPEEAAEMGRRAAARRRKPQSERARR